MSAVLQGVIWFLVAIALTSCDQQFDSSKVDGALAGLETPYRSVKATYWGDGGSVSVQVVDKRERTQFLFVSARLDESNPYSRVFAGGIPGQDPSVREIVDPVATKSMLGAILRAKNHRTPEEDLCLAKLSGNPLDYLRAGVRRLLGQ